MRWPPCRFTANIWGGSDRKRFRDWFVASDEQMNSTNVNFSSAKVEQVQQSAPCTTTFRLTDVHFRRSTGGRFDPYDMPAGTTANQARVSVDWARIVRTTRSEMRQPDGPFAGYSVYLFMLNKIPISFAFPRTEDANRAQFAIEFLRAACAPKSTTGF